MNVVKFQRPLGRTGLHVSAIGFGAFKIGRNQKTRYTDHYDLPEDTEVSNLLSECQALGINYIDTAPAYGVSESRLGEHLKQMDFKPIISTKVGERFENGTSSYHFDRMSVNTSVDQSIKRLDCNQLDLVFVHAHQDDLSIQKSTEVVPALRDLKDAGKVKFIGFSVKTEAGAEAAMNWADVLMLEYNLHQQQMHDIMNEASSRGIGVVVKKGLGSGQIDAEEAISFVLKHPSVASLIVGSLNTNHLAANCLAAKRVLDQCL